MYYLSTDLVVLLVFVRDSFVPFENGGALPDYCIFLLISMTDLCWKFTQLMVKTVWNLLCVHVSFP
jgi:hypothetical protein